MATPLENLQGIQKRFNDALAPRKGVKMPAGGFRAPDLPQLGPLPADKTMIQRLVHGANPYSDTYIRQQAGRC